MLHFTLNYHKNKQARKGKGGGLIFNIITSYLVYTVRYILNYVGGYLAILIFSKTLYYMHMTHSWFCYEMCLTSHSDVQHVQTGSTDRHQDVVRVKDTRGPDWLWQCQFVVTSIPPDLPGFHHPRHSSRLHWFAVLPSTVGQFYQCVVWFSSAGTTWLDLRL